MAKKQESKLLPIADYKGIGKLGNEDIECYVLNNGDRVISYRQCVKLITGKEAGNLVEYIGISGLKSLICKQNLAVETIDFAIPNSSNGKGIKAETFADICGAYVTALYKELLTTDRQREIGIRCAFLQSGFMKLGIVGFVDEITGYRSQCAKDEYQTKVEAYISKEVRKWQKTFPDEIYQEWARLQGIREWWRKPPNYAQMTNDLYRMMDPEIANILDELDNNPNIDKHQYLTEKFGTPRLQAIINKSIGLAKGCCSLQEYNEKVKMLKNGGSYQMQFRYS